LALALMTDEKPIAPGRRAATGSRSPAA